MNTPMCDVLVPFWNRKNLPAPFHNVVKIESETPSRISSKLSRILLEIIGVLENQSLLLRDHVGILKRLIFRMKNVFRNDKGFKAMQMMNKALANFNASSTINDLSSVQKCAYNDKGPSKQMMQWTLVNLQRLVGLFYRINCMGLKAAGFFKERFYSGHHWNVAAVSVAVISKIWSITKYVITQACDWNRSLNYFLQFLPSVGKEWLPENERIEKDLMKWLGNPLSLKKKEIIVNSKPQPEEKMEEEDIPVPIGENCLFFNEDIGESAESPQHIFTSTKDFLDFLQLEKQARATGGKKSKTRSLTKKQWNRLCSDVMNAVKQLKTSTSSTKTNYILTKTNKLILDVIN